MSEKTEDINTCNTTLLAYANNVPVGLLYNKKYADGKRHRAWGHVTTANNLAPNENKPQPIDGCYVFWDYVTNDWIIVGHGDIITWTLENLDTLKHLSDDVSECPSPDVLLNLSAKDATKYCKTLIDETVSIVDNVDNIIKSKNLNLSECEKHGVMSACFKHKATGTSASHNLQPSDIPDFVNASRGDATLNDVLDVFQEYNLEACNCYLALECCIDIDTIVNDTLTEEEMSHSRGKWMDFIRKHRLKAFEELDQLEEEAKKEGSGEEDLQDIDTIKQMFRDIPQDTDLSQYKTLEQLTNFWPSLLLPKPPVAKPSPNISPDPEGELVSILKSVDDIEELQNILDEASLPGSEVPGFAIRELTSRISELISG